MQCIVVPLLEVVALPKVKANYTKRKMIIIMQLMVYTCTHILTIHCCGLSVCLSVCRSLPPVFLSIHCTVCPSSSSWFWWFKPRPTQNRHHHHYHWDHLRRNSSSLLLQASIIYIIWSLLLWFSSHPIPSAHCCLAGTQQTVLRIFTLIPSRIAALVCCTAKWRRLVEHILANAV